MAKIVLNVFQAGVTDVLIFSSEKSKFKVTRSPAFIFIYGWHITRRLASSGVSGPVIVIVIATTMFMVLSSWHCHCESSPGSSDECSNSSTQRQVAADLWTKPISLSQ